MENDLVAVTRGTAIEVGRPGRPPDGQGQERHYGVTEELRVSKRQRHHPQRDPEIAPSRQVVPLT